MLSAHRIKLYLHDASEVIDGGVQRLRLAQSRLEYATVGEHLAQSIDQQLRLAATTLEPILQLVGIRTTDTNKRIWYREYIPLHAEFYTVTDKLIDQLRFVAQYIPETSQFAEYCQQIQRSVLQLRRALNSVFIDHRTSSKRDRNRKTFAKSDFLTIAQDPIADFLSFVNGNITKFEAPPSSDGATSYPDYLRERAEQVDLLEKYLDGLIGQCLADFDALTAFMQSKQSQPSADCGGANGGGCVKYLEISELVDRVLASFTDLENTFKLVSGARLTLNNANFNSTIHQLLTKAIDELKQCTDNQRNKKGYPSLRIKNYFDAVGPSMNEVKQALLDHAASKLSTVVATSAMADKPTDTAPPAEIPA